MVRVSTPRSLLLIDEFGKGTAPADGVALACALLRHLSRTKRMCLLTLHFHEIFRSADARGGKETRGNTLRSMPVNHRFPADPVDAAQGMSRREECDTVDWVAPLILLCGPPCFPL